MDKYDHMEPDPNPGEHKSLIARRTRNKIKMALLPKRYTDNGPLLMDGIDKSMSQATKEPVLNYSELQPPNEFMKLKYSRGELDLEENIPKLKKNKKNFNGK